MINNAKSEPFPARSRNLVPEGFAFVGSDRCSKLTRKHMAQGVR